MMYVSVSHSGAIPARFGFMMMMVVMIPWTMYCQQTDQHSVSVTVQPLSVLQMNAGFVTMKITGTGVPAGEDRMTVTEQSTTILWGTNRSMQKITVKTDLLSPKYVLKVFALNPTAGTAASEVTLSVIDTDFMLGIGRSSGSSTVRYTGIALASQGAGTDTHRLTFTIQGQ